MNFARMLLVAAAVATLGACTTSLNDQDRALIASAVTNAQQAKDLAKQALTAAQNAQASATTAAQSASNAASDAQYVPAVAA